MLKKVDAGQKNKTGAIYGSKRGVRYYEAKGNARNLRTKLIKKGVDPSELSVIGYMLMLVEIDDKAVEA